MLMTRAYLMVMIIQTCIVEKNPEKCLLSSYLSKKIIIFFMIKKGGGYYSPKAIGCQ